MELDRKLESEIRAHGEHAFPEECCGLLIGRYKNGVPVVTEVRRMRNTNEGSRNTRYNIDPLELISVDRELENTDLEMIGIYHSHPNHPSRPSETDLKFAWPNLSYIVLSVRDGVADLITSWRLDIDTEKFVQEKITGEDNK